MSNCTYGHNRKIVALLIWLILLSSACNYTRHITGNQHLLRKNTITLKSDKVITNKGELKDNLGKLAVPKPNTTILGFPYKLWLYNARYDKYQKDSTNFQLKSKTAEKPALFDTAQMHRSAQNMKAYMVNQGYFYSRVSDTFSFKQKKAYVKYTVTAGDNYLINKTTYDVDDSDAAKIVAGAVKESGLQKNAEFTYTMLEDERGRITSLLRDHGYYRFSQENVTFQLDTVNKSYFKDLESPFESAFTFIEQKSKKKPTLDIIVRVRPTAEDSLVYVKYSIAKVQVVPDYATPADLTDSTMRIATLDNVTFRYHKYYVKEHVLLKHIYLLPGKVYSQSDYDKTIVKLNELGIFQFIRITFREDPKNKQTLDCTIALSRTKKHDFSASYELSSGSTYSLGNSVSLSFRDRNIAKGANLLTTSVTGGLETIYNSNLGNTIVDHFLLLTKYYGFNTSIDFPKFLAPIASSKFDNSSLPHTIIGVGTNFIDRVDYFTLVNTSANFTYSWHQTETKTWTLSPAFINIIRLPKETDSFKRVLDVNEYLRNSYKQNFIEGENISFTYNDNEKKRGRNYSYLKLGFEEAGALLSGINQLGTSLNDLYNIKYAQYVKFDFDARHYFTFPHSTAAFRFYGGVGVPYGQSSALPYIKQYYVGGPYSMRGWRIRSLGPGSFYDTLQQRTYIDLTGDIKLELNGEYRFDIAMLFSGGVKMNGAIFADAGNIWLTREDPSYPGGNFQIRNLGQDIAMSTGIGVRFDIASFLTLRLDVAIPVKKPYVNSNYGWVLDQINFGDPTWRSNNIVPQFAVGYPF